MLFSCDLNVNEYDDRGRLALCLAIRNRDVKSIKVLLAKGANVDLVPKSSLYKSALITAVEIKDVSIVAMLLKHGAYIDIVDTQFNNTALLTALYNISTPEIDHMHESYDSTYKSTFDIIKLLIEPMSTLQTEMELQRYIWPVAVRALLCLC